MTKVPGETLTEWLHTLHESPTGGALAMFYAARVSVALDEGDQAAARELTDAYTARLTALAERTTDHAPDPSTLADDDASREGLRRPLWDVTDLSVDDGTAVRMNEAHIATCPLDDDAMVYVNVVQEDVWDQATDAIALGSPRVALSIPDGATLSASQAEALAAAVQRASTIAQLSPHGCRA